MKYLLVLLCVSTTLSLFTQKIELPLYDAKLPTVGARFIATPIGHNLEEQTAEYSVMSVVFFINSKIEQDTISFVVSDGADKIVEYSYPVDSVARWALDESYYLHSSKFIYNNSSFFFIPGTKAIYNESVYNRFPCMISDGNVKESFLPLNDSIQFFVFRNYKNHYLVVKENGERHTNKSYKDMQYKERYQKGDTIPLDSKQYILNDIDWYNSVISIEPIIRTNAYPVLDKTHIEYFDKYFNGKQYLFIDFWGTWCNPCIQSLPSMKALQSSYCSCVAFLSICYDSPECFDKANELLESNQIHWPNILVSFDDKDSIIRQLKVDRFPTTILLDKTGRVIFRLTGDNNYPHIVTLLNSMCNSDTKSDSIS